MSDKAQDPQLPRRLYTPQAVQNRVIALHLEGASNREIALEESIDRATVNRILSQRELVTMLAEQQSHLLRLAPKAIAVYEKALDSQDLGMAVATATKILEGTGVLNKRGLQQTIDDSIRRQQDHETYPLPEFAQGAYEFRRRKSRRKPVSAEFRIVEDPLMEEQHRNEDIPAGENAHTERIPAKGNA